MTYEPRKCTGCYQMRPSTDFVSARPRARCQQCREKAYQTARKVEGGISAIRAAHLWAKYRLRPEQYDAMRERQGYRCAVCGTHEDDLQPLRTGRPRVNGEPPAESFRLVVDHCHATNRVRGLLCTGCNTAIGHAKDSAKTLRAAADYLEAFGELGSVAS